MRAVESQWWIIELPPEWEAEQEDESIIIGDEDGVGEIVITTMEKQDDIVSDEELVEFTQDLEKNYGKGTKINISELDGYYYHYREDNDAVREWCLRCDSLLVLITYSCDESNAGMDDSAVDEILSTLYVKQESQ
jgi:hypothetical protein